MALIKYPYTNLHELNLDWLIEQLNNPDGPVRSVNGKSGIVTLTGEDIERSSGNPETVAAALTSQGTAIQTVRTQIGVTALPTVAQTLTGAIAENAQEIADVEDNVIGSTALPTTAQTLTGAIAENAGNIGNNASDITSINNKIGDTALPTVAQTLTGGVAENAGNISSLATTVGQLPRIAPINWEPSGPDASVTSGTAVTIAAVSDIIPAGASARGVIKYSAYGSSNYDFDGSLMIVGSNIRYMPKITQASIRVYGAIIYTL